MNEITLGTFGPWGLLPYKVPVWGLDRHLYVVGETGRGKSWFLAGFVKQLAAQKIGSATVDIQADLANNILSLLEDHQNVILVEPGRDDYYMPWNVLATPGEPYAVATNIIDAFRRSWSSLSNAPRFEETALNGLLLLIEHGQTLPDLHRLLLDERYRTGLVARTNNEAVRLFFQRSFSPATIESTRNKLNPLVHNPIINRMLGASENRIDLRSIMDNGQILIVNLGSCDAETQRLIGSLIVVFAEQAAMSRGNIPEWKRRPYFLVVDEFQSFITSGPGKALEEMLSKARKMKVSLVLAHQGIHQIDSSRLSGALKQAHTKVVFGCDNETAKHMADELFKPVLSKGSGSQAYQRNLFVQRLRDQRDRMITVQAQGHGRLASLKTITLTPQHRQLEPIKQAILKRCAVPIERAEVKKQSTIPEQKRFYE